MPEAGPIASRRSCCPWRWPCDPASIFGGLRLGVQWIDSRQLGWSCLLTDPLRPLGRSAQGWPNRCQTASRSGQRYISLFHDLGGARLLFACEGLGKGAVKRIDEQVERVLHQMVKTQRTQLRSNGLWLAALTLPQAISTGLGHRCWRSERQRRPRYASSTRRSVVGRAPLTTCPALSAERDEAGKAPIWQYLPVNGSSW